MSVESGRVHLVTADPGLRAAVARLAAAGGARLDCVESLTSTPAAWSGAAVLIGSDVVEEVARTAPPRRDRVYLIGSRGRAPDLGTALACGATAALVLPEDDGLLVSLLADIAEGSPARAITVGVIGGAGGVGSSTFAAALALTAAGSAPAVVLDADVLGSGIDQVLGLDPGAGLRWDDLLESTGRISGRALRDALPRCADASVLAWPMDRAVALDPAGVRDVVGAAQRGFAAVVIDLPRDLRAPVDELAHRCDRLVVVSVATVPAVAATARLLRRTALDDPVLVLRRKPGGVEAADAGRFLGVAPVVVMRDQRGLDEDVALGAGPLRRSRGPLARAARDVAAMVFGGAR